MLWNRWFRAFILTSLVMMIFMEPATATNQAIFNRASGMPSAPFLGDYINIWEDAVDNSNQEVIYNPERDEFLSLWISQQSDTTSDVWARRISGSGALLDWYSVYSAVGNRFIEADVAYSPLHHQYLVVMTSKFSDIDCDLYIIHFDDDGTDFSSLTGMELDTRKQEHPALVYNSQQDEYLVVYQNEKADGFIEIVAVRIKGSDFSFIGLTRTTLAAVGANQYRSDPAVAYNPARNNYLVAYSFEDANEPRAYIASKTVSADLTNLGSEVDLSIFWGMEPDIIAFANDQFLVVWSNLPQNDVSARRVNYDGQPFGAGGGFQLSSNPPGSFYARRPHVSFTRNMGFWVAWDRFDGTTPDEGDILASIIFPGRDQAASPDFFIDSDVNYQGEPAIACRPFGSCLLTEVYNLSDYPLGDRDIRGRLLNLQFLYLPVTSK